MFRDDYVKGPRGSREIQYEGRGPFFTHMVGPSMPTHFAQSLRLCKLQRAQDIHELIKNMLVTACILY